MATVKEFKEAYGNRTYTHFVTDHTENGSGMKLDQMLIENSNGQFFIEVIDTFTPIRKIGNSSDRDFKRLVLGMPTGGSFWCTVNVDHIKHDKNGKARMTSNGFQIDKKQVLKLIENLQQVADKMEDI